MKLKYYFPTSIRYIVPQIMRYIAVMGLAIAVALLFLNFAQAMKPPEAYGENQCELIAKDYQREFGGSLIWLQPIDQQNNPILTEYGHVLNKVYDPILKEVRYVDYGNKWSTKADHEIHFMLNGARAKMYDLSKGGPEFNLIWIY